MISCIVPTCNDGSFLNLCIDSLKRSANICNEEVELIILTNNIGGAAAKNFGSFISSGDVLAFVDADCMVSPEFFSEISEKATNPYWLGGGMRCVIPTNPSFGVRVFILFLALYCKIRSISVGVLCIRRDIFHTLNGFKRDKKYYDIDFALRLRGYAKTKGGLFKSLRISKLLWSTRKFEQYGDWHWLRGYHTG